MKLIKKAVEHNGSLYTSCYCPAMDLLFVGGADKIMSSWSLDNFQNHTFSIKTKSAILHLNMLGENTLLIGLFNGHFHLINIKEKKEIKYFTKHQLGIYSSAFAQEVNLFVLGTGNGVLSVWDATTFDLLIEKKICEGKIRAIEIQGDVIWVGTSEGLLLKINSKTLMLLETIKVGEFAIFTIAFLPEKEVLVLGDKNAHLSIYSLKLNNVILQVPAHNWPIYKILNIPTIGLVSASRDKTIKVWNPQDLSFLQRLSFPEFKAHTHSVNHLTWVEKHQVLVSVGDDKAICFWKK